MSLWEKIKEWDEFIAYLIVLGSMLAVAISMRLGLIP